MSGYEMSLSDGGMIMIRHSKEDKIDEGLAYDDSALCKLLEYMLHGNKEEKSINYLFWRKDEIL
jgi:hypothetical protein